MRRVVAVTLLLCAGLWCLARAQEGRPVGPNSPCTAFGTASGTCVQGGVITAGGPTGTAVQPPVITYNAAGQLIAVNSATALARSQSTPAGKAITASTATQMLGLAGSITPTVSGNVLFQVRGDVQASTISDCTWQIRFGTGTAPLNGAASTGTNAGNSSNPSTATTAVPLTLIGYVTGLTPGTAEWIDVAATTSASSITCTMFNPTVIAIEE